MGADHSKAVGLTAADTFQRSVLLIQAPATLYGYDLRETAWHVMRSVSVAVVRWDGGFRPAERHRDAVGDHVGVLYFFDPLERTAAEVNSRLEKVLLLTLQSIGRDVRVYACVHTAQLNTGGDAARRVNHSDVLRQFLERHSRDNVNTQRVEFRTIASEQDINSLFCPMALALLPTKIERPVANLAADMASTCGATEALIIDACSCLPLVTWSADGGTRERVVGLCGALRASLLSLLAAEHAAVRFLSIATANGKLFCGWAAQPHCYAVLFVPFAADGAMTIGDGLVRHNFSHYAEHFANVVDNTTQRETFTAIMPS
jgi:hypothetical protein